MSDCTTLLRESTGSSITIKQGTSRLVNLECAAIIAARRDDTPHRIPDLWDGRAAERIADVLAGTAAR